MEENKLWYVANTYSGHENKVAEKLVMRTESTGMQDYIYRVIVPEMTEVENKDGVMKEKIVKMFPGYVLVEMIMTDESWSVIRNTPGVTGFIGSSGKGAKPTALADEEIDRILSTVGMSRMVEDNDYVVGDSVSIVDGPFKGMVGTIESIDEETGMLNVVIDLFRQETIVEVELSQVSRV
ncbi:MAG: transcription termination/antitermination protein NusG [bacterium]